MRLRRSIPAWVFTTSDSIERMRASVSVRPDCDVYVNGDFSVRDAPRGWRGDDSLYANPGVEGDGSVFEHF